MSTADWGAIADEQEKNLNLQVSGLRLSQNGQGDSGAGAPHDGFKDEQEKELAPAEASLLTKILRSKLVTSTYDVEIQRKDPKSPLWSAKSFEDLRLRPELLKGVYSMGFNSPSKIQETALPALLADPPHNLIAQSQSGTGKTAAFVLAMLSRIDPLQGYTQAICLSPTFELALQTAKVIQMMTKYAPEITLRVAVKGEMVRSSFNEHILIGTPGKILDWALKYKFFDIKKVKVFVLDEADIMINTQGHQEQSIRIHKQVNKSLCQMMLFSATYDEQVMRFAESIITDPIIIRLKREEESLDNIRQCYVECPTEADKYTALANVYGLTTIGQTMIFCRTRHCAKWLVETMSRDGHAVALLSGELTPDQRIAVLDRFRDGKEKVLITTDVLARGIDVEQVTLVVNFDMPVMVNNPTKPDYETYLHRIGRTGRFGKSGLAINMIDNEKSMAILNLIAKHFGRPIDKLDTEDADEIQRILQ